MVEVWIGGAGVAAGASLYTFVTTEQFLVAFGLETLADLPDREQLEDVGMVETAAP